MKKWVVAVSCMLFTLALATGCATSSKNNEGASKKPAEQGQQAGGGTSGGQKQNAQHIYQANCTSCHGKNLEGAVGPSLTKVGSKYKNADEIKNVIVKGRDGMPGGLVSEADAKILADWLITKK
jgi:cytochrome c551